MAVTLYCTEMFNWCIFNFNYYLPLQLGLLLIQYYIKWKLYLDCRNICSFITAFDVEVYEKGYDMKLNSTILMHFIYLNVWKLKVW
jgi:hypothetical protein